MKSNQEVLKVLNQMGTKQASTLDAMQYPRLTDEQLNLIAEMHFLVTDNTDESNPAKAARTAQEVAERIIFIAKSNLGQLMLRKHHEQFYAVLQDINQYLKQEYLVTELDDYLLECRTLVEEINRNEYTLALSIAPVATLSPPSSPPQSVITASTPQLWLSTIATSFSEALARMINCGELTVETVLQENPISRTLEGQGVTNPNTNQPTISRSNWLDNYLNSNRSQARELGLISNAPPVTNPTPEARVRTDIGLIIADCIRRFNDLGGSALNAAIIASGAYDPIPEPVVTANEPTLAEPITPAAKADTTPFTTKAELAKAESVPQTSKSIGKSDISQSNKRPTNLLWYALLGLIAIAVVGIGVLVSLKVSVASTSIIAAARGSLRSAPTATINRAFPTQAVKLEPKV